MRPRHWLWVGLLVVSAAPPIAAQTPECQYIVSVAPEQARTAAFQNNLTASGRLDRYAGGVFLFSDPLCRPSSDVLSHLKSTPGVIKCELNALASLPEADSG